MTSGLEVDDDAWVPASEVNEILFDEVPATQVNQTRQLYKPIPCGYKRRNGGKKEMRVQKENARNGLPNATTAAVLLTKLQRNPLKLANEPPDAILQRRRQISALEKVGCAQVMVRHELKLTSRWGCPETKNQPRWNLKYMVRKSFLRLCTHITDATSSQKKSSVVRTSDC
jgi:hypothetical protein